MSSSTCHCGTCIYTVLGTTWTFVYKDVANCACAAAIWTRISLEFLLFLGDYFNVLSGIWCEFALQQMWYVCCLRGLQVC